LIWTPLFEFIATSLTLHSNRNLLTYLQPIIYPILHSASTHPKGWVDVEFEARDA